MNILHQAARRLERLEALDKVARPPPGAVSRAVRPRVVRNLLSGTHLGHPLHPVLTDLPIGAWVMSALLDAVGGPAAEGAADLLVTAGVGAAVPTAAAGLNDWSDTAGPQTRVGLVHAAVNTTALSLYLASLVARARATARRPGAGPGRARGAAGRRVPGRAPVLRHGRGCQPHRVGAAAGPVDAGAGRHRTGRWGALQGRRGWRAGPVVRTAETVYALDSACTHMGGPLREGTISDGCVTCPWPGSTFRFADGSIMRSPASTPEPSYQTRIQNGRIEVRAFT